MHKSLLFACKYVYAHTMYMIDECSKLDRALVHCQRALAAKRTSLQPLVAFLQTTYIYMHMCRQTSCVLTYSKLIRTSKQWCALSHTLDTGMCLAALQRAADLPHFGAQFDPADATKRGSSQAHVQLLTEERMGEGHSCHTGMADLEFDISS